MAGYSSNAYFAQYGTEMTYNAGFILAFFLDKGWTKNAICAMLGNMQRESTINPGIWQNLDFGNQAGGYGLVQWTPATKLINWCNSQNVPYDVLDFQCIRIQTELETGIDGQWIATSSYPESFYEFSRSTKDIDYLTRCFLKNYERAGEEAISERIAHANHWLNTLNESGGSVTTNFIPRTNSTGIRGSYYWYDGNPFYLAGYGLPNCTCYAYGRFWEISDICDDNNANYSSKPTGLSLHDAGKWFAESTYEKGQLAKLGAVACWSDNSGGAGHVAIVEAIAENGDITVSQSAWLGSFLYVNTKKASQGYSYSGKTFQGFIYNPFVKTGIIPDTPTPTPSRKKKKKKGYNFTIFKKRRIV